MTMNGMDEPAKPTKRASVKENINPAILKRMQDLGIPSILQLSDRCGVAPTTLYKGLGGMCEFSFGNAVKVAQALGWTSDYFAMIYLSQNPFAKNSKSSATISSCEATEGVDPCSVKSAKNLCGLYGAERVA